MATIRRRCILVLLAAAVALLSVAARGGEDPEHFLPAGTFLCGGVDQLGAGYDKVMGLLRRTLPGLGVPDDAKLFEELAEELDIEDVRTRDEFIARTGLDPAGGAVIAWVLDDPSYWFFRSPNENVLVVLPVKDAARAEQAVAAGFLPATYRQMPRLCRSMLYRVQHAKRMWKEKNREAPDKPLTWPDLAAATPGLKPCRCPGGGQYTIGKLAEEPTCSVHGRGGGAPPELEGPITRQTLGVQTAGAITLVGGRKAGTGYLITPSHIVLTNNMNVLEDSFAAAAGKAPRARLAARGELIKGADGRVFMQSRVLLDALGFEVARWGARRVSFATERLLPLFAAGGELTAEVRLGQPIAVSLRGNIARNPATEALLGTAPAVPEAFALVPESALAAWGGNIGRLALGVLGDIALVAEPMIAGATKLTMAGADGDAAFAFTRGTFDDEVPNMVFIVRARDREVLQSAVEVWGAMLVREFRAEALERSKVDGVEILSMRGRRDNGFHFAWVGPYAVAATSLDDVRAVIALHGGKGQALVASPRYRKLEMPESKVNLVTFMDMAGLIRQIVEGEREQRARWRNESCRRNMQQIEQAIAAFRKAQGRFPATFDELARGGREGKRVRVQPWCMMFGQGTKLKLDPQRGKVSCPAHGSLADFTPIRRDEREHVDEEAVFFSAFGTWALQLRIQGDGVVGEGRLIPAPQVRSKDGRHGHL